MTAPGNPQVLIRPLTQGPHYHWFGYYDKLQFDETGRYVLAMEVAFEGRSPAVDDTIRVGMIDLEDGDRWIPLGETQAWCWQQGCMLQWRPQSKAEVIYNIRAGDGFGARILDAQTRVSRTIPHPIYTLSPDGTSALSLDFLRLGRLRPGYGYAGVDPTAAMRAPDSHGIYHVDLESGIASLIISIAQVAAIPSDQANLAGTEQWLNHLLFSPDGNRFLFLHRWRDPATGLVKATRMFTANPDGSGIRLLHDAAMFSHFFWRDNQHILAWAHRETSGDAFYLIDAVTGEAEAIGVDAMKCDGHCTYIPGTEWILNDSYPQSATRRDQELYLYHPRKGVRLELGLFHSPPAYSGEWRCDLHPRCSRDGRFITIDSTHAGHGRQVYLLDLGELLG